MDIEDAWEIVRTSTDSQLVDEALSALCAEQIADAQREAIVRLLSIIVHSRRPGYTADCIAVACGMTHLHGEPWCPATIAKHYGLSREIVCRNVHEICEALGINPKIALRTSYHGELGYAECNYHHHNHET